jgi:flagellar motor protein MotB
MSFIRLTITFMFMTLASVGNAETNTIDDLYIPANKLAANGFGEFQPIDDRDTPEAYKTNRRIEIRLTEK